LTRDAAMPGGGGRKRAGPALFGLPFRFAWAIAFLLGLAPLMRWIVLIATGDLGANPVEFLTRSSGRWALIVLLVVLAMTPLARLTRQAGFIRLRRMAGLFAFFYVCLHLTTYVWWDQWFDPAKIAADIWKRPFITAGFAAFLLLLPLAVTSTKGWVRRLGGTNWQRLHRAVYVAAPLAVLHLWWIRAGKNDFRDPGIFLAVLAVLLGWRLVLRWRRERAAAPDFLTRRSMPRTSTSISSGPDA